MARIVESGPITPVTLVDGSLPSGNVGQQTSADSLSVVLSSDHAELDTSFSREFTELTLTYDNDTDPEAFVDIRPYAMLEVLIPAAANGHSMDILFADNVGGDNAGIPLFKKSDDTWAALIQVASVSTGQRYILQAENAAGHFFGLRFGAAITGSVTVRVKS